MTQQPVLMSISPTPSSSPEKITLGVERISSLLSAHLIRRLQTYHKVQGSALVLVRTFYQQTYHISSLHYSR